MVRRRTALLGAGLALAAPAGAQDGPARQVSAFAALAGVPGILELDRDSTLLRPWTRSLRSGLWAAAAVARSVGGPCKSADDRLHATLLEPDGAGFRVLAAGQASAMADEPLWRVTPDPALGCWPTPGGAPLLAVSLSNNDTSTARSASSTGLHLFRWDRQALRPVFAAIVQRSAYDKHGAVACVARQGFARPGKGGRQAPDAVAAACDRRNTEDGAWTVDASTAPGGTGASTWPGGVAPPLSGVAYDLLEFNP